jgi:predicted Fe-Mo cluster-binding NifX family protein
MEKRPLVEIMVRVAIACDKGNVSEHFGFCEEFVVYEIEENKIKNREVLKNPGHIPGFLPKFLKEKNVDVVITKGIGPRAVELLHSLGIKVISTVSGSEKEVIERYVEGQLKEASEACKEYDVD